MINNRKYVHFIKYKLLLISIIFFILLSILIRSTDYYYFNTQMIYSIKLIFSTYTIKPLSAFIVQITLLCFAYVLTTYLFATEVVTYNQKNIRIKDSHAHFIKLNKEIETKTDFYIRSLSQTNNTVTFQQTGIIRQVFVSLKTTMQLNTLFNLKLHPIVKIQENNLTQSIRSKHFRIVLINYFVIVIATITALFIIDLNKPLSYVIQFTSLLIMMLVLLIYANLNFDTAISIEGNNIILFHPQSNFGLVISPSDISRIEGYYLYLYSNQIKIKQLITKHQISMIKPMIQVNSDTGGQV